MIQNTPKSPAPTEAQWYSYFRITTDILPFLNLFLFLPQFGMISVYMRFAIFLFSMIPSFLTHGYHGVRYRYISYKFAQFHGVGAVVMGILFLTGSAWLLWAGFWFWAR